jgi:hypothetical protein
MNQLARRIPSSAITTSTWVVRSTDRYRCRTAPASIAPPHSAPAPKTAGPGAEGPAPPLVHSMSPPRTARLTPASTVALRQPAPRLAMTRIAALTTFVTGSRNVTTIVPMRADRDLRNHCVNPLTSAYRQPGAATAGMHVPESGSVSACRCRAAGRENGHASPRSTTAAGNAPWFP